MSAFVGLLALVAAGVILRRAINEAGGEFQPMDENDQ